jgi:hypothetical protein
LNFISLKNSGMVICLTALALALSGCGRNGKPLPPPGVSENQTPPFINEFTSGTQDSNNTIRDRDPDHPAAQPDTTLQGATEAASKPAAAVQSKKPLFLDPLL